MSESIAPLQLTTAPVTTASNDAQLSFLSDELPLEEDPRYLSEQLITYIGNKRSLLREIGEQVAKVKQRLGKKRLRVWDVFAGSGVVSRYLKAHAECVVSSDIEDFAAVIGRCYLRNRNAVDPEKLCEITHDLNRRVEENHLGPGFIEELYAPRDEGHITVEDRVFYTVQNARRLDNYRRLLEEVSNEHRAMLFGPLLSEASVHANTAGVFKGFYKDRQTGIGQYGGSNSDALTRIRGCIMLTPPVLSRFECETEVYQEDANQLVQRLSDLDLAYLDPPYNQHPYGSNYFMLNLLLNYKRPSAISKVSGIPVDWQRSEYNRRSACARQLRQLVHDMDARFILVSFNNEGFIAPAEMETILREVGQVETVRIHYNAFRACRNFNGRSIHVTEQLFLVERK
jgi:adenine-specific DNA-methyltransferase